MTYQPYIYVFGALISAIGFAVSVQSLLLFGIAFCLGVSVVQLLSALRGFLPALAGGEKPTFQHSFASMLVFSAQILAMIALWCRFSFLEFNPQAMRMGLYLYLPTLLIQLIQMRISVSKEGYKYYQQLLGYSLATASVLFLFFLTPEKKLAQRFYQAEPEKLKIIVTEIEKRTPKKPAKKTDPKVKADTLGTSKNNLDVLLTFYAYTSLQ